MKRIKGDLYMHLWPQVEEDTQPILAKGYSVATHPYHAPWDPTFTRVGENVFWPVAYAAMEKYEKN